MKFASGFGTNVGVIGGKTNRGGYYPHSHYPHRYGY